MSLEIQALRSALSEGNDTRVQNIVDELTRRAWGGELRATDGQEALEELRNSNRFHLMLGLADSILAQSDGLQGVRHLYCLALVEVGALSAAERELEYALTGESSPEEESEFFGLLGRINKGRFAQRREPDDLIAAIRHYRTGWNTHVDPKWHGLNIVALQGAAERFNHLVEKEPGDEMIPRAVLEAVDGEDPGWAMATEAEISLALGNQEGAAKAIARLVASDSPAFVAQSLRRQLIEIWRLDETDPLLLELDNRLVGTGGLVLPGSVAAGDTNGDAVERFEKIFDTAQALSFWNLVEGLVASQSVGKVTDRSGRPMGTAFLVDSGVISASLRPGLILVTNAHVISGRYRGVIGAPDAQVRFDVTRDRHGKSLVCDGLTEIWSSPPYACDITLLDFSHGAPSLQRRLKPAAGLPAAIEGAYVSVIGHPAGGELSLSIRGNDLLEADSERMHYRSPTEPGSSGSPVFDQNWKLIGVHHAGHTHMPRLNGNGFHQANEATTIDYIRSEYERENS